MGAASRHLGDHLGPGVALFQNSIRMVPLLNSPARLEAKRASATIPRNTAMSVTTRMEPSGSDSIAAVTKDSDPLPSRSMFRPPALSNAMIVNNSAKPIMVPPNPNSVAGRDSLTTLS